MLVKQQIGQRKQVWVGHHSQATTHYPRPTTHDPRRTTQRAGATIIEAVLVLGILFLLTNGVVGLALNVFRQQQLAYLAREGARWASVHGGQYASENSKSLTKDSDVWTNAISPRLAGMQSGDVTYSVTWTNSNQMPTNAGVTNYVTVIVNYTGSAYWALMPASWRTSTSVVAIQY